ncbi:hypothetical protein SETIT_1G337600v2 [Setaria italica]|uniref:Uncharacterized protein n=1 Tax=Setaria italica TaxID=4555 RepID=A0A368PS40_SETIT|nr:hypothetical protein SETIT_1G337600v2 [Setaria italica]
MEGRSPILLPRTTSAPAAQSSPHLSSPPQAQAQVRLSLLGGWLAALLIKQDSRKGPWWVVCARTAHMIRGARVGDIIMFALIGSEEPIEDRVVG